MTIKDIARESGYGVGTVSRVLNNHPNVSESARRAVLAVVEKYDFQLNANAKHLKQQTTAAIALVVRGTSNMLFATLVEQLQELIKNRGYLCLVYYIDETDDEVNQALQICQERRPRGLILLGRDKENFAARFRRIKIPCLLLTNVAPDLGFPNLSSVSTDDVAAARAAVSYLIKLGHRKIGILGGPLRHSQTVEARRQGIQEAFQQAGLPFDPAVQYVTSRFSLADGYHAMGKLLDQMADITAVFAMADVTAVAATRAIRERGLRVPEDVSVMGFDGIELGLYLTPKLTTIRQNVSLIASRGLELLLAQIEEGAPPAHELIPYRIIPGESVRDITERLEAVP